MKLSFIVLAQYTSRDCIPASHDLLHDSHCPVIHLETDMENAGEKSLGTVMPQNLKSKLVMFARNINKRERNK